ncbi:hypothetical protein [Pinisolibacter aquiterrae]|uniref:hypothetical protein n=1 Tax=Pinisolibacter aquiterrae TaxID=2815579 RepID=UPI001C3DB7BB|nr:hypothetical protein [Pinisolibacter aquiterrae]MBV5266590.1 hypothetical protein [Pinisolibacter aquiterrae]MCC8234637.1 hypothetical protein [Pinisolibacter aquiterrae]
MTTMAERFGRYLSRLRTFVAATLIAGAAAPALAAAVPDGEREVLRLQEEIVLGRGEGKAVETAVSLTAHTRRDRGIEGVEHRARVFSLAFRSSSLGSIETHRGATGEPDAIARMLATGALEVVRPRDFPIALEDFNRILTERNPTPLSAPSEWRDTIAAANVGGAAAMTIGFRVMPFEDGGRALALVAFESGPVDQTFGAARVTTRLEGIAVLSQDYRTTHLMATRHSGTVDRGDGRGAEPFTVARVLTRIDPKTEVADLDPDRLPQAATFRALVDLAPFRPTSAAPPPLGPPDRTFALLRTSTAAVELAVDVHAERRANILPIVMIAVVISRIDTVDSVTANLVRVIGTATGNEAMAHYPGTMNWALAQVGSALGHLPGVSGDAATRVLQKTWEGVTIVSAAVSTVADPTAMAATVATGGGRLAKIGKVVETFLEKNEEAVAIGIQVVSMADGCITTVREAREGQTWKAADTGIEACADVIGNAELWGKIKKFKNLERAAEAVGILSDTVHFFLDGEDADEVTDLPKTETSGAPSAGGMGAGASAASPSAEVIAAQATASRAPGAGGDASTGATSGTTGTSPAKATERPRMPVIRWPPN